jgi:hypothetical protein
MLGISSGPAADSDDAGATASTAIADGSRTGEAPMVSRAATSAATPSAPALAPRAEAAQRDERGPWCLRMDGNPRASERLRSILAADVLRVYRAVRGREVFTHP